MSIPSSNVRVRFAPSPTGFFHIGSARTALFNWLYARHTNGTFIVRIEDTDVTRNTPEALRVLLDGMKWLGLNWDEGPEVGGPYGPYFQSERGDIYQQYFERLKATGRTYEKDGAWYFRVSGKPQLIQDVIRGTVERLEEKDFVIIRSNGTPVFHFVNVVDDIAMRITHIIRGEDHLSNTSKHTELFAAFGEPTPVFAHIPLILKTDGPGKMSKRDKGSLIDEYQQRHFLPEAITNFLALLGWSPKNDREILSIQEIITLFDLPDINKNNARFDEQKLSYINGEYVRSLSPQAFTERAKPILQSHGLLDAQLDASYVQSVCQLCQEKLRSFEELPALAQSLLSSTVSIDATAKEKVFQKGDPIARLQEASNLLTSTDNWTPAALEEQLKSLAKSHNTPIGQYMQALRLAISGKESGPSFYGMLPLLGKARVLERIQHFLRS